MRSLFISAITLLNNDGVDRPLYEDPPVCEIGEETIDIFASRLLNLRFAPKFLSLCVEVLFRSVAFGRIL